MEERIQEYPIEVRDSDAANQSILACKRAAVVAAVAAARMSLAQAAPIDAVASALESKWMAKEAETAAARGSITNCVVGCDDTTLSAKQEAMFAAVAAARKSAAKDATFAKRLAIEAAVAAAREFTGSKAPRKLTAKDIHGDLNLSVQDGMKPNAKEKDYRQQDNFGATKFIKP
mmetsp:Transcript_24369/g.40316  ORF Transcript_24369/g.40316 Transcript_24369/m.40316 type:complete len:174 (+) Transcript_24369:73-594(+)|eukprot:CAMPEP_0119303800 /NCGR_PEP_ID=MMETSP1333-20130426/5177_1 /TAXON_ID=418940 /ORGANISM="Scyphosphaera apsteinii, Strain RCC1455" /LENGTH=173 /DNA_ID=CAMNT_0007306565 /DNA_START=71 /DNA_END=592 /DNA_ORIENTATION=-